ncbi:MAG TPA: hypothetical protein VFO95_18375 [Gemmatimonadales bacterium]|nr:hypothetical protein [Gemmatimonadales bacterium]
MAVELLTTRRLPIARMEKAAGIIVAGPIAVHPIDADNWAACGYMTEPVRGRLQFLADRVDFGVLVKPLGDGSAVTVTAHWMTGSHGGGECVSRNVWETGLIRAIKAAAERRSGAELHQEGSKRTPPFTAEPKWQR